jgi:GNAT superfamily N-acetyltransferase
VYEQFISLLFLKCIPEGMPHTSIDVAAVSIEPMTQADLKVALQWAIKEGWNPGIHDAECFFNADPHGFYVAKLAGQIVGTFSIVTYSPDFAFEGLVIVRPDLRGNGVGLAIQRFISSHFANVNVGLDGVLQMQEKYERIGFRLAYKNTRYAGVGAERPVGSVPCVSIRTGDFAEVASFDERFFFANRASFLNCWLYQNDAHAFMAKTATGRIQGYGVIRKCVQGHKIGPLFAENLAVADALFSSLTSTVPGEPVFLDVPDVNVFGVQLARAHTMQPVFTTVRMYTKSPPTLPLDNTYGVTSFELG